MRMYRKILVPVDLAHLEKLEKALRTAADLAKHYGASVTYVGATVGEPSEVAHSPEEFAQKLEEFAAAQAKKHGIDGKAKTVRSHDPARDLNNVLLKEIDAEGADLVVMASHVPGLPEHIFTSHAGGVASHAEVSVFVVR
jgi:nucleotide-binding universal stress UspA family protein